MAKVRRSCQKFWKRFDAYGKPIALTYKKEKTFGTMLGGISTILTFGFLIALFISQFTATFVHQTWTTQIETSLTDKNTRFVLQQNDFIVGHKISIRDQTINTSQYV
jgi:hypothetical protein